jgi:hypothetical protein
MTHRRMRWDDPTSWSLRTAFIKKYFGLDWPYRALYDLMVNSRIGDDAVVGTVLQRVAELEKRRRETPANG